MKEIKSNTPINNPSLCDRSGLDPSGPITSLHLEQSAGITIIFGKRGYGKTTLSKILSQRHDRVIVLDPLQEYKDTIMCENIIDVIDYIKNNKRFRLSLINDNESEYLFEMARIEQNICLVLEEVDMICTPSFIGEKFADCIKRGRHWDIELIASSRRPAEVNRLLTSQATDSYVFMISEPGDIKYIEKYTCAEIAVRMGELDKFYFWYYSPENRLPKMGYIKDFSQILFDN